MWFLRGVRYMAVNCNLAASQMNPISSNISVPSFMYIFPPRFVAVWLKKSACWICVLSTKSTLSGTKNGSLSSCFSLSASMFSPFVSSSLPSSADNKANNSLASVWLLVKFSSPSNVPCSLNHLPICFTFPVNSKSELPKINFERSIWKSLFE